MKKKLKPIISMLMLTMASIGTSFAQSYCATDGRSLFGLNLWINSFSLGTINNTSGNNSGYADFTTQTTSLQPGSSNAFTITTGNNLFLNNFNTRIWIDYNADGDFIDAGELAFQGSGNGSLTGTINVPANATGSTAMRVAVKRFGFPPVCGNYRLGETEDYSVSFSASCNAIAGTITADLTNVCAKAGFALLTATPDGNAIVPAGYQTIYVLTSGAGLVIEQVSSNPAFNVSNGGNYTIHTLVYDPATLDLNIVVPGVTTGFDVNGLIIQGGGTICASLDVAGASISAENPFAGTLSGSQTFCSNATTANFVATPNGNAIVPAGYQTIFVLTSGAGLVIEQVSPTPNFTVTTTGNYTIHTLVYNPLTLNLSIVVPGVTTGFDVYGLLVDGGGSICASLDVAGAKYSFANPTAGTLTAATSSVCFNGTSTSISATADGNAIVPAGYQTLYVLTSGAGLVIEQVSATPNFTVSGTGLYTIHTLVYDPNTLDLSIVVFGTTTGVDVNGLLVQGGGSICASLDVAGAPVTIANPTAGTLTAASSSVCFNGTSTTISATADGNAIVPAGYQTLYVLTSGAGLVIEQVSATPSFTVSGTGLYTIHTLVYDPATLDLSIVVPGVTTGVDVNGLLVQGGGSICASLDVAGAPVTIANPTAGTLTAASSSVCFNGTSTTISATADGNAIVPAGYQTLYVLTSGAGLVIEQVSATPSFTVSGTGLYTIHTLVYDPATLDLSIVVLGVTTGVDVNGLLVQGGGSICASLDVAGAPVTIANPTAGTLTAASSSVCFNGTSTTISATADGNAIVPAGYQTLYVLTSGAGLVIEQVSATPSFTVSGTGLYTIHTLVYDPATLDLSIVVPGVTTGVDVNGLLVQGGGSICASLDVAGAPVTIANPTAGTLTAASSSVCFNGTSTTISATADGNAIVPAGYQTLYVLTSGAGLVIEQVSATPSFTVSGTGLYTIHTLVYDPATLDLSIVVLGVTTGVDVNGLLVQGGGSICASLDVAGAPVTIANPTAGTLTAASSSVCFNGTSTTISATADGNAIVPAGYQTLYVLTSGAGLVIEQVSATPSFTVSGTGLYTIHTLVYDPATLDLSIVVPGVTTGVDVNGLLVQGGGSICASLDVAGAPVTIANPTAGTLTAASSSVCFNGTSTTISATADGNAIVPAGYQTLYVLTSGAGLVIEQVSATPSFTVSGTGLYTIHTLVYDPATLDLSIVVLGVTTGVDVNGLLVQGGGSICASLDVAGAPVTIANPTAGTLTAASGSVCFNGTSTTISATADGNAIVPAGYQTLYVLTSGAGLVIEQVSATPSFTVSGTGLYTIHTLVYDPATLDLSIVVPGVTTGVDVNGLLVQGGGSICASLDVAGAPVTIANPTAGTLTAASSSVCFNGTSTTISATADGNAIVPAGYQTLYVLTSGAGLVIEQVSATPSFTVSGTGLYTIHTLVYDPATLDLSIVVLGVTTGVDVNGLLVQGGGSICASLDVAGAPVTIANPTAGTLTAASSSVCFNGTSTTISATADGNAIVPAGYQTLYVLTSGAGLVIEQVSATPSFTVSGTGLYTIHTLVYDPATLDLSIVVPGVTTGVDVNGLLVQGGGSICASLDVAGAPVTIANPTAGTLTAASSSVCFNGTSTTISATADGNAIVPAGYQTLYVLTSGAGLIIEQVSATPSFTVSGTGLYTIHTLVYDPATLDLSIVVPGVTTGVDVNGLLVQGGGSICASLDVAGAPVTIANPTAGTLTAASSSVCFNGTSTTISATADGNAIVPAGYQTLYVLTSGAGLIIEQVSATPSFTVSGTGLYTIHTLVYDPATLDLSIVVPGVTTGVDVNGLLVQGGGSICASLDVAGAPVTIANPTAGTITTDDFIVCLDNGTATVSATPNGNAIVPAGFQTVYVLTRGQGLVIQQAGATPSFTVSQVGLYRIHTLVYDPNTLNLGIVVPGVTTGFDVNGLLVQGGGSICASLDVTGAPAIVFGPVICGIFNLQYPTAPSDETTMEQIRISAEEEAMTTLSASVYPNPARDNANLSIELAKGGKVSITVFDMTGKKMLSSEKVMQAGLNTEMLSLENVSEGTYMVLIESENESKQIRLIIIK